MNDVTSSKSLARASGWCMVAAIASIVVADHAHSDALVVTRAMKASTIAEIFVDDDQIRVEIEVGAADLKAFQNILPDELFEKLAGRSQPLVERRRTFLERDWVLRADGEKLSGTIKSILPAKRVIRDEITGDPLPNQPEDAEIVIRIELIYPFGGQPNSLSIQPPLDNNSNAAAANIGFVVYHRGVAVNDFRYLSQAETLQLDWSDPWYSALERSTLRRRYYAPAAAFLYVENFEVRKEIIFRPKDLQQWVDMGLDGTSTIKAAERKAICNKAASYLAEHTPVQIDGKPSSGTLDRVHFIERTLRSSGVVEPDEDIDVENALIGAIYVYPIDSLPQKVTMNWDLFNDRIARVPTVATDEAGGMPSYLEPEEPLLVWKNFLTNPSIPAFMQVRPPSPQKALPISLISILCCAAIAVVWLQRKKQQLQASRLSWPITYTVVLVAVGIAAAFSPNFRLEVPLSNRQDVSDNDASDIIHSLLHNVYRAFDYRDDGTIYDVLSRSASGDLLTQIFLETRQSLTLASQGGAQVKVKEIELISCRSQSNENDSFMVDCQWTVTGSVGHWGHIHQRKNQYHGEFLVRAIDGQWKLTEMEILSEERL